MVSVPASESLSQKNRDFGKDDSSLLFTFLVRVNTKDINSEAVIEPHLLAEAANPWMA